MLKPFLRYKYIAFLAICLCDDIYWSKWGLDMPTASPRRYAMAQLVEL